MSDQTLREQLEGLRDKWRRGIFAQDRDGDMRKSQAKRCADELETVLAAHPVGVDPGAEPWLYAITEPSGAWHDGENCVFGDRESAKDEVDLLNDSLESGEEGFKLVPLYRAAAPQPVQLDGERASAVAIKLDQMARRTTILAMELAYKCLKSFTIQSTHPDAARVRDICYTLLGVKYHRAEPDESGEWMGKPAALAAQPTKPGSERE